MYYAYRTMFAFLTRLFSTRILSLVVPETLLIFSCYILADYWASGTDPKRMISGSRKLSNWAARTR